MQDLIRPDASFTPRELFSRMQGAWFEPRIGYMWQEDTGATPTTSGGQTIGKLVDLSADRVASQATAANRPLFGARRNLLVYTEDFSNAAWYKYNATITASNITAPDGSATAYEVQGNAIGAYISQNTITCTSLPFYASVWIKATEEFSILVGIASAGQRYIVHELKSITTSWKQFSVFGTALSTDTFTAQLNIQAPTGKVVHVWHPYLRRNDISGYVPDYQRVTTATDYDAGPFPAVRHADSTDVLAAAMPDLGGGVFSSAGSVYFATPQGMSALHNQSIGTSYNLPALQTDIYGTVITPARLAPPLEQKLALYMHRLAGLADADFFWQEDYGPELVTNGGFSNGTTGWTPGAGSSISVVSGELEIANAGEYGNTYQTITTVAGKTYAISGYVRLGTTIVLGVYVGTVAGGTTLLARFVSASFTYTFVASAQTTYITFINQTNTVGHTSYIDNISVREVLDGQVGQLLADDNDTILLRA